MTELFKLDENEKEKILGNYLNKKIELTLNAGLYRKRNKRKGIIKGFFHGYYRQIILKQPKQEIYISICQIVDFKVI